MYFDKFKEAVFYADKENNIQDNQTKYLFNDIAININKAKRIYLEIEEIKKLKVIKFGKEQETSDWDIDFFNSDIHRLLLPRFKEHEKIAIG